MVVGLANVAERKAPSDVGKPTVVGRHSQLPDLVQRQLAIENNEGAIAPKAESKAAFNLAIHFMWDIGRDKAEDRTLRRFGASASGFISIGIAE
jgi:hypothetical protein